MIVCVKNVAGFVSVDKDGRWVCTGSHKTERLPNPVSCKSVLIAFGSDVAKNNLILD